MKSGKILVTVFFSIMILMSLAAFLMPKAERSELENRYLAKAPTITLQNIADKTFMTQAEKFLSDHIPFREEFGVVKTQLEMLAGKREIEGVYINSGRLMMNIPEPNEAITSGNAEAINLFAEKYEGKIDTFAMLVPTALEFYPDDAPPFASPADQTAYIQRFYGMLTNTVGIDTYAPLASSVKDYIFYRTDHHWTSYGAYIGYTALAKSLGYKVATADMFNIEHASHDFLGTLYSKTLTGKELVDNIDLYTYAPGNVVEDVIVYGEKNTVTYSSVFFRENLEKKDQYMVFLGENAPMVTIKTNVNKGKKLLVFKDSFANSLMQFLPLHYAEITLIDLRYFNGNPEDYLKLEDYQQALFLYNVGNFTDSSQLNKLASF